MDDGSNSGPPVLWIAWGCYHLYDEVEISCLFESEDEVFAMMIRDLENSNVSDQSQFPSLQAVLLEQRALTR